MCSSCLLEYHRRFNHERGPVDTQGSFMVVAFGVGAVMR